MTTCLIVNWGVITILSVLLAFSEWLSKTDRFKEKWSNRFHNYSIKNNVT